MDNAVKAFQPETLYGGSISGHICRKMFPPTTNLFRAEL